MVEQLIQQLLADKDCGPMVKAAITYDVYDDRGRFHHSKLLEAMIIMGTPPEKPFSQIFERANKIIRSN